MTLEAEKWLCLAAFYRLKMELAEEEAQRIEARERENAVLAALHLYQGKPTARATGLAKDYASYLGRHWSRDRENGLAASATQQRRALYRVAVSRDGDGACMRTIFDIAKKCKPTI
ncbi:MAG: hypothetical protein AB7U61_07150 [Methylocystis sp.]